MTSTAPAAAPAWLQYLPLAVSWLAVPTLAALRRSSASGESWPLFLVAAAICLAVFAAPYLALRGTSRTLPWQFYAFSFFAFACVVDLVLALTAFGSTDLGMFYLEKGERHLRSVHGAFINSWDFLFHYPCYLALCSGYLSAAQSSPGFARTALLWAGSILNSLAVLLPGLAAGRYGPEVEPSLLLNVPFAILPAIFAASHASAAVPASPAVLGTAQDRLVALTLLALAAGNAYRALVALGAPSPAFSSHLAAEPYLRDTSAFPLLQCLVDLFWLSPFLLVAAYHLARKAAAPGWLAPAAVFAAGAALQARWSYVGGWLHECGPSCGDSGGWKRPSWEGAGFWAAVGFNAVGAAAPVLLAWRLVGGGVAGKGKGKVKGG